MGIFDDYGIDPDSIKESSFDKKDGTYRFEISEAETRDGSTNNPNNTFFVITYQLEDENGDPAGEHNSWTTLVRRDEDGEDIGLTAGQAVGLSIFKGTLKTLGIKAAELAAFTGAEIVGLTGTLTLKTTTRNGKSNQNLKIIEVDERPAPKVKAAPAAKKASPKKAAEETGEDSDDDNPFG